VERFEREARLAAELRHRHIVQIYDVGDHDGIYYIAMELLHGRALRQLVVDDSPLPLDRVGWLLRQLAEALDFAHEHGVAHRDVKPGNVFVDANDHLTLVDFGIARGRGGAPDRDRGNRRDGRVPGARGGAGRGARPGL
jgi:serine/threonine protein kinase